MKSIAFCVRPWLNWIEHLTTDQKVGGSNPSGRATNFLPASAGFFLLHEVMRNKSTTRTKWSNLIQIYRMMFRYWHILLMGLVAMLLYALFSGISITLVIPLFDYVFRASPVPVQYHDAGAFIQELLGRIGGFFAETGSVFSIRNLNDLTPLWESIKDLMQHTDSLALLWVICGFVVVTIILKNIFFYIHRVLLISLRGNTVRDVRNLMFSKYMGQSLEFYNQHRVGDAIVRMVNDVNIVSDQFIRSILDALRDVISIAVYLRIALLLNPRLLLYSVIIVPLFTLMVSVLGKKIKKYSKRIQAQLSNMFSAVEEALNSMKIVKAFRREESEYHNFKAINNAHLSQWKKAQYYTTLNVPITELNTVAMGVVVIILGGELILSPGSTFSLGDFTAFLFALFSMLHPLKSLTQIYIEIKKALVSLERISAVMNREPTVVDAVDAVEKHGFEKSIEFSKVSFYYEPGKPVIQDFDLVIHKGEKVALVGSSGGGKTTLANLLNRMYDVKEGSIKIDGVDVRQIKLSHLRKLFGVVTQDSLLFTRSLRDNIAYGSLEPVSDEQLRRAAEIANADEFIQQYPGQYDGILQSKGSNLSGGQRQRLCIARAIVGDPPILIFDEATSALDTENEQKVQQAIDEATQNRTVILIAHRLSTILKADKIVVIEQGRIVGQGTHAELMESCPRYQYLYNLQFSNGQ